MKNTTKNEYNSNNPINKTLNRKNSNPLPAIKINKKPIKEGIVTKDENSDYVVFQNPNHNDLPDYHQVLKNNSTKNANARKINNNNRKREDEEENIFNLGKPQVKSYEKENLANTYASHEENNEGKKKFYLKRNLNFFIKEFLKF